MKTTTRRRPYDWQLEDDLAALMALAGEELSQRVRRFVAALKAGELHVGVGVGKGPVVCVTCGVPWPCKASPHK